MEDYITSLNEDQKKAVTNINGPILILAGAGTGKTRTITSRIAYILNNNFALPSQILAVTFTNKAANEMLSRINELTCASNIWLGTFHAIATKILRQHAEAVGLKSDFTIIGTDDQLQVIKTIVNDMHPEYASDAYKIILNKIQRWKDRGLVPTNISDTELNKPINTIALSTYNIYQERLKFLNCADFGDLLLYNIEIFTKQHNILSHYQEQFKYIMVDEYQDINTIQYLWLRLLAQKHKNLCCVGDDDQSIYSWRGAEVGNILKFSDDFPNAKTIRLECNYRSTSNILEVATAIINNNKSRLGKKLWTTNQEGNKVNLMKFWDSRIEAQYICEYIKNLHDYQFKETAILVRAGFQTRIFEEYFIKYNIPYRIIGSTRFYDRQEIRDIIAYLKITVNPQHDIAFDRIINKPKRNVGASTLNKIYSYAKQYNTHFLDATKILIEDNQLSEKTSRSLNNLLNKINSWKESLLSDSISNTVKMIAYDSGYIDMLENEGESGLARIENIKELFSALLNFNDVNAFLEHISLVTEVDISNDDDNYTCIMTLHAAKGLEFPVVFLPGWEEGVFPHEKSLQDRTGEALEEERRLAYVGITRAREQLFISCVAVRDINNWRQQMEISRFIKELPIEHIQVIKNISNYH
ncbi:ATP-dependent helicase [Ehrlichia ruminantium]|uniref:ATP-dependent helicase n=1 Tax=Ehrlichia ruminantium TaxID=779 RepID=UPI00004A0AD8|nr:UvrD-helicase domain-containing protein [Ehrlichia ruminantium]KYW94982.1 DNA helicase II [Ehrlichia ruminantium]QLK54915.1 DNA helicase II [Ehrlichia ruminantium]QLK55832.1 DNA helicase II [Ehrlichia ruminantium]UOD99935.1 UvrD-helicase domain-containing protein [Ehrlichia ruminantium]CAH57956.1 DNA helicase II [Ehrlichia ruminantium str. Welgevonden]